MYEFRERFQGAADVLANWPVVVRMRQPYLKGVGGLMTVAEAGFIVIDLDPDRPILDVYKTFLHEAAHAVLHRKTLDKTSDHKLRPGVETQSRVEWAACREDPREKAADALAESWAAWAAKTADAVIGPGCPDEVRVCVYLKTLEYMR